MYRLPIERPLVRRTGTKKPRDFRARKVTSEASRSKIQTRKKPRTLILTGMQGQWQHAQSPRNSHIQQRLRNAQRYQNQSQGRNYPDQQNPYRHTEDNHGHGHRVPNSLKCQKTGGAEGRTPRI